MNATQNAWLICLRHWKKFFESPQASSRFFVSSRNDRGIVCHLQSYPNLEISSDRNRDDIACFVKAETKKLVQQKKLLRFSRAKKEMEELIAKKVIDGANGM